MSEGSGAFLWYWGSTLLLAVLLFYPVHRFIWVLRVRRLERKLGRRTSDDEREEQRRRARLVAGLIAISFAFLYNRTLLSSIAG